MIRISDIRTPDGVVSKLIEMYGTDLSGQTGVRHVAAVWDQGDSYVVLRINQDTPRSEHDRFILNVCRAWADAIVTSGKILRDEPDLSHTVQGTRSMRRALAEWAGHSPGTLSLVLTSGRDLPWGHPFFRGGPGQTVWIFTSKRAARTLEPVVPNGVVAIGHERPSIESAIRHLRTSGFQRISVEAGPSATRELYDGTPKVDELLLTTLHARRLEPSVRGGHFVRAGRLSDSFRESHPPFHTFEGGVEWRFRRFERKSVTNLT